MIPSFTSHSLISFFGRIIKEIHLTHCPESRVHFSDPFGLDTYDPTEPWWHHDYPREVFVDKYPIPWLDPDAAPHGRWMPFAAHQSVHANGLNSAWEDWLTDYIGKNSRYPSYDELETQRMLFREDPRFEFAYSFGENTAYGYKNLRCKNAVNEKEAVRKAFAEKENLIRRAVTRGELRVGERTLEKLSVRKVAKTTLGSLLSIVATPIFFTSDWYNYGWEDAFYHAVPYVDDAELGYLMWKEGSDALATPWIHLGDNTGGLRYPVPGVLY